MNEGGPSPAEASDGARGVADSWPRIVVALALLKVVVGLLAGGSLLFWLEEPFATRVPYLVAAALTFTAGAFVLLPSGRTNPAARYLGIVLLLAATTYANATIAWATSAMASAGFPNSFAYLQLSAFSPYFLWRFAGRIPSGYAPGSARKAPARFHSRLAGAGVGADHRECFDGCGTRGPGAQRGRAARVAAQTSGRHVLLGRGVRPDAVGLGFPDLEDAPCQSSRTDEKSRAQRGDPPGRRPSSAGNHRGGFLRDHPESLRSSHQRFLHPAGHGRDHPHHPVLNRVRRPAAQGHRRSPGGQKSDPVHAGAIHPDRRNTAPAHRHDRVSVRTARSNGGPAHHRREIFESGRPQRHGARGFAFSQILAG